jgi:hypothetical protein
MDILDHVLFKRLIESGPRLAWITRWLLEEVWSPECYRTLSPVQFLRTGEEKVNRFEMLVAAAADRIYDELLSAPDPSRNLLEELSDSNTAVVIFDGLSIREVPMILNLAVKSGLTVSLKSTSRAAVPSETLDFIARELSCGHVAPSQLPTRKELKEKGIFASYTNDITQPLAGDYEAFPLLIWSAFPDATYKDSGARFESHFENIHALFETAWINTVQTIKSKKRIIITSDHGYIYFGAGMDFPRSSSEMKPLNTYFGNDRNVSLDEKPDFPVNDDLYIGESQKIAMVKGRVRTRSTGEAARKLYRHGGLSLMEMITPWIELEADS